MLSPTGTLKELLRERILLMSTTINLHEPPPRSDAKAFLNYQIAVMQAFAAGRSIEVRHKDAVNEGSWQQIDDPRWEWNTINYRVAPPKIANGHNPSSLTDEQVGEHEGWRFLSREEQINLSSVYPAGATAEPNNRSKLLDLAVRGPHTNAWQTGDIIGVWPIRTPYAYRTKKPVGFYLPKSPVAAGHNPASLTEEQVGVKEGWRLLTEEEVRNQTGASRADIELRTGEADSHPWRTAYDYTRIDVQFNWTYRTKKPVGFYLPKSPIAGGHNPRGLTEEQVGVKDGWRTLSVEERQALKADYHSSTTAGVEYWQTGSSGGWASPATGCCTPDTYRTKKPVGFYLPKPKAKLIREWLVDLPVGYRERALKNLKPDAQAATSTTLSSAIFNSCWWRLTPEGEKFWRQVFRWAEAKESSTPVAVPELPPLPQEKKLVPWTANTLPVDRFQVRLKTGSSWVYLILAWDSHSVRLPGYDVPYETLTTHYEHSLDGGKTWLPCGTLE